MPQIDPNVVQKYQQQFAKMGKDTRRLFDGPVLQTDVIEITPALLTTIKPSLDEAIESWKYDKNLFAMARENYPVSPAMVPMLWRLLPRKFMSYDYFLHCFAACGGKVEVPAGKSAQDYLIARTYQTYNGGFLRELDLCRTALEMRPDLKIKKVLHADLAGVDLVFADANKEHFIAIKHQGETSSHYNTIKKDGKEIGVRKLTAHYEQGNDGIHRVDREQVALLFEYW